MIVDSHCHLDYPVLFNNMKNVLKRADENNIKYLLTICTTLDSFEKIVKIIHSEIRKEMSKFLKKHINKKIVNLQ